MLKRPIPLSVRSPIRRSLFRSYFQRLVGLPEQCLEAILAEVHSDCSYTAFVFSAASNRDLKHLKYGVSFPRGALLHAATLWGVAAGHVTVLNLDQIVIEDAFLLSLSQSLLAGTLREFRSKKSRLSSTSAYAWPRFVALEKLVCHLNQHFISVFDCIGEISKCTTLKDLNFSVALPHSTSAPKTDLSLFSHTLGGSSLPLLRKLKLPGLHHTSILPEVLALISTRPESLRKQLEILYFGFSAFIESTDLIVLHSLLPRLRKVACGSLGGESHLFVHAELRAPARPFACFREFSDSICFSWEYLARLAAVAPSLESLDLRCSQGAEFDLEKVSELFPNLLHLDYTSPDATSFPRIFPSGLKSLAISLGEDVFPAIEDDKLVHDSVEELLDLICRQLPSLEKLSLAIPGQPSVPTRRQFSNLLLRLQQLKVLELTPNLGESSKSGNFARRFRLSHPNLEEFHVSPSEPLDLRIDLCPRFSGSQVMQALEWDGFAPDNTFLANTREYCFSLHRASPHNLPSISGSSWRILSSPSVLSVPRRFLSLSGLVELSLALGRISPPELIMLMVALKFLRSLRISLVLRTSDSPEFSTLAWPTHRFLSEFFLRLSPDPDVTFAPSIELSSFPILATLSVTGFFHSLTVSELPSLSQIMLGSSGTMMFDSRISVEHCPVLSYFRASHLELASLRVVDCPQLRQFYCATSFSDEFVVEAFEAANSVEVAHLDNVWRNMILDKLPRL